MSTLYQKKYPDSIDIFEKYEIISLVCCPVEGLAISNEAGKERNKMKIKCIKKAPAKKVVAKKVVKTPAVKKPTKVATKAITFTVHADKGKSVYLAGEFNDWDPTAKKLAYKARSGIYATTLKLAPGSYQYKFVIDGIWCADPENADAVPNDQGTFNSVVTVC